MTLSETALDGRARRAARRIGLLAVKSRKHVGTTNNYGDYMLLDPQTNCCVCGSSFDLTVKEVLAYCREDKPASRRKR